jgi:hypothetical protein
MRPETRPRHESSRTDLHLVPVHGDLSFLIFSLRIGDFVVIHIRIAIDTVLRTGPYRS